jgi:hypothetical protein
VQRLKRAHTPDDIIIVVGHALAEPWISLRRLGQEPTWLQACPYPVVHAYGRPLGGFGRKVDILHERSRQHPVGRFIQRGFSKAYVARRSSLPTWIRTSDGIYVDIPDTWFNGGWKFIASIASALNDNSWSFFYCTTNGSYINSQALGHAVERLPTSGVYAGIRYMDRRENWLCGYSVLLSRDVAELIVQNHRHWDHSVHNDRALGRLMRAFGVATIELPHRSISDPRDVAEIPEAALRDVYNFRCKVPSDRTVDVQIMHALHKRLHGSGPNGSSS